MSTRMLIDARHDEETRVTVVKGSRVEEFDYESATRRQLKGNIYLARVTRVEPSLQAAFVEYGGNRHGFLAFSEIHPDYYQIPVQDREEIMAAEMEAARAHAAKEAEEEEREEKKKRKPRRRRKTKSQQDETKAPEQATEDAQAPDNSDNRDTSEDEAPKAAPKAADDASTAANTDSGKDGSDKDGSDDVMAEDTGAEEDVVTASPEDLGPSEEAEIEDDDAADNETDASDDEDDTDTQEGDEEERDAEIEEAALRRRSLRALKRRYNIQEVIKKRQVLLIQVVKEERGNKGAALTTYLSLAGRYCVLMANSTHAGGISRKIAHGTDRKRLKSVIQSLNIPTEMGLIIRTAGMMRTKTEIKRDYDYLLRLWNGIRELTLKSIAPALIYEEGDLIKRTIRDLYTRDIDEILVEGERGYRSAKDFMKLLMPSHAKKVQNYKDRIPLFHRYQVESQLESMYSPEVQLKSGGYIVMNPTEALISIDVNSGRSTKEHNIEETALRTNLEAAEEIARQLRLRDMAGLVVIDFIDMEDRSNNRAVERKIKEMLKSDRARIQVGRISSFGLMEMSRQRLRPNLLEASTVTCPTCTGTGIVRSTESVALLVLRQLEEEGIRGRSAIIRISAQPDIAIYLLNKKRDDLVELEQAYNFSIEILASKDVPPSGVELSREAAVEGERPTGPAADVVTIDNIVNIEEEAPEPEKKPEPRARTERARTETDDKDERGRRKRRRRRRTRGGDESREVAAQSSSETSDEDSTAPGKPDASDEDGTDSRGRRRRGRRGGRRRGRKDETQSQEAVAESAASEDRVEADQPQATSVAAGPEADADAEPKAEKPRRRRRVKKAASDEQPVADEKTEQPATETDTAKEPDAAAAAPDAPDAPDAPASEPEKQEKPKRRRRTTKKTEDDASPVKSASDADAPATEAVASDADKPAEEKPKRRRRTTKKTEDASETGDAAAEAKPKRTRRTTKKSEDKAETTKAVKPKETKAVKPEASKPGKEKPAKEKPAEEKPADAEPQKPAPVKTPTADAPVATPEPSAPADDRPKKKGWWNRTFG